MSCLLSGHSFAVSRPVEALVPGRWSVALPCPSFVLVGWPRGAPRRCFHGWLAVPVALRCHPSAFLRSSHPFSCGPAAPLVPALLFALVLRHNRHSGTRALDSWKRTRLYCSSCQLEPVFLLLAQSNTVLIAACVSFLMTRKSIMFGTTCWPLLFPRFYDHLTAIESGRLALSCHFALDILCGYTLGQVYCS